MITVASWITSLTVLFLFFTIILKFEDWIEERKMQKQLKYYRWLEKQGK